MDAEILPGLLTGRYEQGSVLVTSNLDFASRTEIFGDPRLTAALHIHVLQPALSIFIADAVLRVYPVVARSLGYPPLESATAEVRFQRAVAAFVAIGFRQRCAEFT